MKKFVMTMAAFICAVTVFTGCNKDEDEGETSSITSINVNVESGSNYNASIDTVKAMIAAEDSYYEIASGKYSSGGFSISLPKTVDEQYLEKINTDKPDGIKISDTETKGCSIELMGYKSNQLAGSFKYALTDDIDEANEGGYLYVDKNVTITGSYSESLLGISFKEVYNLSLKKGWNLIYMQTSISPTDYSITMEFSNKAITGLKWFFIEEDNSYYNYSSQAKSATTIETLIKGKPFLW